MYTFMFTTLYIIPAVAVTELEVEEGSGGLLTGIVVVVILAVLVVAVMAIIILVLLLKLKRLL